MTNIIVAATILIVWPVFYVMLRNTTKPKKNIILGVTLPQHAHNEAETLSICKSFRKWLNVVMIPFLLMVIPPFFMQSTGAVITWCMGWLLFIIVAPYVVFARHRGKLMALKRTKNWHSKASGRALADIKIAAMPHRKISGLWFLPPFIAGLIPVVHSLTVSADWGLALAYASILSVIIVLWLCYHLIFRVRSELLNEDAALTAALTRVRRYNWGKMSLAASWLSGALILVFWAFKDNMTGFLVATLFYCVIMVILSLHTEFATRTAQQNLTAKDTGDFYLDEDEYWLLGMFYHNPNDNHFLVNARIGMNMSVNLAKPAGKVVTAFAVLCILLMPFFGIWVWTEETTPIKLHLSENTLTVRHTRDRYVIQLDTIQSVELLDTLPPTIRVAGTGMDNLYTGNFRVEGYGSSRLCMRPKDPPFLVIISGGRTYIVNDADSTVTRQIYLRLGAL